MEKLTDEVELLSYLIVGILWLILQIFITISVIKRFHDFNKSGWLSILIWIPILNILTTFMLFFIAGKNENNKYSNLVSSYKFNGMRWLLLIIEIIFIIVALFVFSFAKQFEILEIKEKQEKKLEYERNYLGNGTADINNIVLTISDARGRAKLMKLSITLKTKEPAIRAIVKQHKSEIINSFIQLLSERSSEELLTTGGKEMLKEEMIDSFNDIINDTIPEDNTDRYRSPITNLFFTSYIIMDSP